MSKKYKSKTPLPREGTLVVNCKVTSREGSTLEEGRSTSLNVLRGTAFLLSNALTQCKFGHIKHLYGEGWKNYFISSDTVIEDDDIKITINSFHYEYNTYNQIVRFKNINVKNKRYVQVFQKKGNRYVFKERYKTKYDKVKKIRAVKDEYDL